MGQAALQPATSLNVDRALQSALDGRRISREQAVLLIEHAETGDLLSAASSLRQKFKGKIVSYSRKVFIPLTHLCRDYCGYCTFRADPSPNRPAYMTPDEVLEIAERGARAGCKEALFSLGDQPERIFVEAREFLQRLGHSRTLDYLASLTELVLEKTGLLPHSNPGLMGAGDLARLRRSNVSLGLMLESTSVRLRQKGAAHWRAPDKAPALRLRTIEEAGRQKIPFTTGILIGIGETIRERVDSLFAIREMHERYGHIQEVLVQPFRAKENTRMVDRPNPSLVELQRTLAVARLTMPELNIQSPPNLVSDDFPELLAAGINDWGGISPVTQDFINPEAAWPQIRVLEERTGSYGLELRERLAIYPEYAKRSDFVDSTVVAGMRQHLENDFYARAHRT
jgi:7,8-didemethyl-8-hydroxy-5-deazariboflavin synthase CofG subunit